MVDRIRILSTNSYKIYIFFLDFIFIFRVFELFIEMPQYLQQINLASHCVWTMVLSSLAMNNVNFNRIYRNFQSTTAHSYLHIHDHNLKKKLIISVQNCVNSFYVIPNHF